MKASAGRQPREDHYQQKYDKWPFATLSFAIHVGIKSVHGRTETHTSSMNRALNNTPITRTTIYWPSALATMFRTYALDVANRSMSIPVSP